MRMSGFLVGGILGAAAAMYFSRNNKPMLLANVNWDQAVDKAGQFVRSAKTMWDTASIVTATSSSDKKSGPGLSKVEEIIHSDPTLSHQVDEIMKDSHKQTVTQ